MKLCKYAALFFLILSGALWAQEEQSRWRLYFAEGGYTVMSEGRQIAEMPPDGIYLEPGDLVQTGQGGAELQLIPMGAISTRADYTLLKLGENTSLQIGEHSSSMDLLYGRIRLITGTASGRAVIVNGGNSSADLREADAGLDYIISQSAASIQPVFAVHLFRGRGEIIPIRDGIYDVSRLSLSEGETVRTEFHTPLSYVERKSLDPDIVQYWDNHRFSGFAPLAIPGTVLPNQIPDLSLPQEPIAEVEEEPITFAVETPTNDAARILKGQKVNIGLSLMLNLSGAVMLGIAHYGDLSETQAKLLYLGGFIPLGLGSSFLLSGAANNPAIGFSLDPVNAAAIKNRRIGMGLGFGLTVAGAALLGYAHYGNLSDNTAKLLNIGAYVPIGLGSAFLFSMLVNGP
jgi:hypothetical protein